MERSVDNICSSISDKEKAVVEKLTHEQTLISRKAV